MWPQRNIVHTQLVLICHGVSHGQSVYPSVRLALSLVDLQRPPKVFPVLNLAQATWCVCGTGLHTHLGQAR